MLWLIQAKLRTRPLQQRRVRSATAKTSPAGVNRAASGWRREPSRPTPLIQLNSISNDLAIVRRVRLRSNSEKVCRPFHVAEAKAVNRFDLHPTPKRWRARPHAYRHDTRQQGWEAFPYNLPVLALLACWSGWGAETNLPITPAGKIFCLFNGTNLNGFHTWLSDTRLADPRQVFTVTNGMIRISGDGLGYLATEQAYQDFRLVVEFKWGQRNRAWGDRIGKARDSGIFLHAVGPDGNSHDGKGAFMAAIECNLF